MWTRSGLCRICEYPVSYEGVRVGQLDAAKLSNWWSRTLGEEDEANPATKKRKLICQFCVWDARLDHENFVDKSNAELSSDNECNWWSGHDNNQFFLKFYYQDKVLTRCMVEIGPDADRILLISNQVAGIEKNQPEKVFDIFGKTAVEKTTKTVPTKHIPCFRCSCSVSCQASLVVHMRRVHPGQFVLCKHDNKCNQVFSTEEEKAEHVLKKHKITGKIVKCEFCHRKYNLKVAVYHMKKYHGKDNLLRCMHRECKTFFRSDVERLEHEEIMHHIEDGKKCTFCNKYMPKYTYGTHLKNKHESQLASAFKCTFMKCITYFLTEEQRAEHTDRVHRKPILRDNVKCLYCSKLFTQRGTMHHHVRTLHRGKIFRCRFWKCSLYFHTRPQLDAHFERVHRSVEDKKLFKCSMCSYKTIICNNLKNHKIEIHGVKDKPCPKCGKCYATLKKLKQHIQLHEVFECQFCNSLVHNLQSHQRRFECNNCHQIHPCALSARLHLKRCELEYV